MTPSLLKTSGLLLYGPSWAEGLSANLCISKRSLRRWCAGGDVPTGASEDIIDLIDARMFDLSMLKEELEKDLK